MKTTLRTAHMCLTNHLKATHRLPMVKRARGDRAPVAVLLVRSISSSDLPMLITTRIAVLSVL